MGKKLRHTKKRIGILLTDSKNEAKKEEVISLRRRIPPRPWIKEVDFKLNPDFRIDRDAYKLKYFDLEVPRTVGIATDVSIGEYLKTYHGDTFVVDYIRPKDITKERLAQNDINFLIIYDLLESFHIDRSKGKRVYHNFLEVARGSDNIFPNWELQEFIGSKLLYYNYFKSVGIPICPTHTLTRDEFEEQVASESEAGAEEDAQERVITKILEKILSENWGKFIAKPVLGQESKSCKTFRPCANLKKMFMKYVITTLKKYPGLIFQKFIANFGESIDVPEVRTYWVGDEYQFSMVATRTKIYCLAEEGHKPVGRKQNGMMKLPKGADLGTLKSIAKRVIDVLQSKVTTTTPNGNLLPLLMTRVDMGVMRDGEFKPWVNEVEYVPSYYVEDHTRAIEGTVANQCAIIAKMYLGIENKAGVQSTAGVQKSISFKRTPVVKSRARSKLPAMDIGSAIKSSKENTAGSAQRSSSPGATRSLAKEEEPATTEPTTEATTEANSEDESNAMDSSVLVAELQNDMSMDIDLNMTL